MAAGTRHGKSPSELGFLHIWCCHNVSAAERGIAQLPNRGLTVRAAVAVLWEVMIAEMRAQYADLAARSKFAEPKEIISDTRSIVAEAIGGPAKQRESIEHRIARSADRLAAAASDGGFIEVG